MDQNTINELVEKTLQGDTTSMLEMAKYLLSGGEHPYLDARLLLTCAAEGGNTEAATLLKLIDWDRIKSKSENSALRKQQETPAPSTDDVEEKIPNTAPETDEDWAQDDEDDEEEEETEMDGKVDVLLQAKAIYRSWRDSYAEERNPLEREDSMRLFTEAVNEYERGERSIDNDLIEACVLLAQYHDEAGNKEEALRFMKLGADHGQATLAYTYGRYLQDIGQAEEAENYFKQSLEGQFTKVRARQALAMLYLQTPGFFQKHKTEAWQYITEGIELLEAQRTITPECYILYPLKGDYLRRIGNYKSACKAYEVALDKLQKDDNAPKELAVVAASSLAELYARAGNGPKANKYNLMVKKFQEQL